MITLILMLALVGFAVWAIVTYIPMPDIMRKLIIVLVVVMVVLYLVNMFGVDLPVPHVRKQ